ncbi:MAG: DegT/DnrJ/EryC1/StrS family aminotransferase [Deltaproteobacteria bacterium]|nr:DegT/DnrJ/EryC1/StrS family aminotransferase [Deltaproteobacteria bacterium]
MVLLNDFVRQWAEIDRDATAALAAVGASGYYILGPSVAAFEERLARLCGPRHAVGVGNGLDAIAIGLRAAGCQPGQRVLTTPLSAFATTLAILQAGAVPCFVDVDRDGLLDLDRVEEALARSPSFAFLLPVHLYGRPLALRRLRALGERFGVPIIEDCAQAIGASHDGVPVGTVGVAAALSFYPTKNLGCLGDGGALLTEDAGLAERARALRNYGQSSRYRHDHIGCNSRLDELQAAILSTALLPRLAGWNARRGAIAQAYCRGIANPALATPRADCPGAVWHLFPVLVRQGEREAFAAHLAAHGVQSAVHYPRLIPEQAALRTYGKYEVLDSLERAREFAARELSLPIHPYLTALEIDTVVAACNSWRPA